MRAKHLQVVQAGNLGDHSSKARTLQIFQRKNILKGANAKYIEKLFDFILRNFMMLATLQKIIFALLPDNTVPLTYKTNAILIKIQRIFNEFWLQSH